jgi:hypothetical protein
MFPTDLRERGAKRGGGNEHADAAEQVRHGRREEAEQKGVSVAYVQELCGGQHPRWIGVRGWQCEETQQEIRIREFDYAY